MLRAVELPTISLDLEFFLEALVMISSWAQPVHIDISFICLREQEKYHLLAAVKLTTIHTNLTV
jgi:hypothetical protein